MKKYLIKLSKNNIKLNCQIVLCPNYNDKEELLNTLTELYGLSGAVESVAVVPVGLTAHRQNLAKIQGVSEALAGETIDLCEVFNRNHCQNGQFVYCSDEFYIRANREFPPYEWYGSFPQIENGVGLIVKFEREFEGTLQESPKKTLSRHVTVITGMSAKETIERAAKKLTAHFQGLTIDVLPVENTFFGSSVTVTGLLTATDILKNKQKISNASQGVIITSCMLKEFETVFLDGMSVEGLSKELQKEIFVSENTGKGFFRSIVGE